MRFLGWGIGCLLAAFVASADPTPPALFQRSIARNDSLQRDSGVTLTVKESDIDFPLFIPKSCQTAQSNLVVTIHFHTAAWFIIQEHIRRDAPHPLACIHLGEGSSIYQRAFTNAGRLSRVVAEIEAGLQKHFSNGTRVAGLELSSFSAGYGAIREILRNNTNTHLIRAVVLADSMYGSLSKQSPMREPAPEHIRVWQPFANQALSANARFLITFSEVPTSTYASSSECAQALAKSLELSFTPVPSTVPAAQDKDFPLLRRIDVKGLHIWHYGGTNAQAHLTHARHLADLWRAIE